MTLASGTRLGPYEITAKLGEGGMGEVYRATDRKLRREVAIKVLPAAFTEDRERLDRFEREARVLASLNHPNIGAIYGLEESEGVRALVMELVEGPTLAERLAAGLSLDQSLAIALQITHALEEAHEKGIVHRDLKPQNVKASIDGLEGKVKVLDFGLAKAMQPRSSAAMSPADLEHSPTVTMGGTREGMILGTAAYMAPEQARGAAVDKRADIWAFGVVLYEMLAGERLFAERSVVDTLSAVMRKEIDLGRLPPSVPPRIRELVGRCLERDPKRRLRDIGEARMALSDPSAGSLPGPVAATAPPAGSRALVLGAAIAVGAALLGWLALRQRGTTIEGQAAPVRTVRFQVPPPPGAEFPANVESVYLAVSPDGSTLAFVAQRLGEPSSVWLRRIDEIAARPLAGSAGARSLAFSPDGRSLAFFAGGKLKRIDFDGGATVPICDAPAGTGLAASWGAGDQILFASVQGDSIYRVPAAGGTPEKVVVPDVSSGEFRVAWPQYLPDGLAFLYLGRSNDNQSRLMLVEPGASPRAVGPLDSRFELIAPDLLVFAREGALFAQRFDRASGRLVGPLSSIAPAVRYFYSSAWAGFGTSPDGTIVLLDQESSHRLVWFDRQGRRQESVGPEGTYQHLSIAADGRSLLASRIQPGFGTHDLWLTDLERGVETRLTSSPDADFGGLMHPDGRSLIYSRVAGATAPAMARRDLGTGGEQVLLSRPTFQFATDISRDGRFLAFVERGEEGKFHASVVGLDGRSEPQRLFAPTSGEGDVRFSPDGRYVAYLSDESGTWEAYVSPLASPGSKTRLSPRGASRVRWSRDGKEIFLLTPDRQVVSVPVETAQVLRVGMPVTLFTVAPESIWVDFDVAPDSRRFLAIVRERSGGAQPATAILGWRPPPA